MQGKVDEIKNQFLGLEERIQKFLVHNERVEITAKERMDVYNKVFRATSSKGGEDSWQKVNSDLYEFYIQRQRLFLRFWHDKVAKLHGLPFLETLHNAWEKLKIFIRWSNTIFLPLNKYAKAYKNVTLLQRVLQIKREMIRDINPKFRAALLDEFKKERDHDQCDTGLIKDLFRVYFEVDFEKHAKLAIVNKRFMYSYKGDPDEQKLESFDTLMKEDLEMATADYYARKLQEWLSLTVPDFLDTANKYLAEEDLRIQRYYNERRPNMWKRLTDEIIVKSSNQIIKNETSGLFKLLLEENHVYVKKLYDFLTTIKIELHNFTAYALNYVRHKIGDFKKEFEDEGEKADPIKFIDKLSNFRKSTLDICGNCFKSNKSIIGSVKLELQSEFSKIDNYPQMLAGYMDNFIVKRGKDQESLEVEEQIENIFEMVNLTAERVAFLHFYEQTLKSRLLSVTNYYESMENDFLKRITQIMGEQQIIKIKGMIQDMVNSQKINTDFQKFLQGRSKKYAAIKGLDLEISLLTKSKWPADVLELNICKPPRIMAEVEKAFDEYYHSDSKGTGKKIDWLYGEGFIEVIGTYKKGKKNLIVSVPQYAALDTLQRANKDMKLTLGELRNIIGYNKKMQAPIFGPLIAKKILCREKDKKAKISDEELFWINTKFKSKNRKLNLINRKTLKNRNAKADKKAINDIKKVSIEAAVVRIMKSKKVAKFNVLAADVRKVLQDYFQPSDSLLRRMIEDLIKREYLERDEDEMNLFRYKA